MQTYTQCWAWPFIAADGLRAAGILCHFQRHGKDVHACMSDTLQPLNAYIHAVAGHGELPMQLDQLLKKLESLEHGKLTLVTAFGSSAQLAVFTRALEQSCKTMLRIACVSMIANDAWKAQIRADTH